MALNAATLALDITNALINANIVHERDRGDLGASMTILAGAIVDHIKTYGEVDAGITVNVDPNTGAGATSAPGRIS